MRKERKFGYLHKGLMVAAAMALLAAGVVVSSMLLLVGLVAVAMLVLAVMYPEKIVYVFLFLYALSPDFLGIDLGASFPLITVGRGFLMLYIVLELVLNWHILKANFFRLGRSGMSFVIVLFVLIHCIVLVRYFNSESVKKMLSMLFENLLLMYILFLRIRDKAELKKCVDILLISAVVICVLGGFEFLTGENLFIRLGGARQGFESMLDAGDVLMRSGFHRVYGPFIHPLAMACYMVVMLPLALENFLTESVGTYKALYGVAVVLILCNLLFTMSRAPLIFAFLGFLLYFLLLDRTHKVLLGKILVPCLVALALLWLFGLAPSFITDGLYSMAASLFGVDSGNFGTNLDAFSFRFRQFDVAFRVTSAQPWLGNGLGYLRLTPIYDFYYQFFPYQQYQVTSFDNYYLIKLMETGILGLGSFVLIFLQVGRKCFSNIRRKINHPASRTMLFIMVSYFGSIATVDESNTLKYLWLAVAFFMCSNCFSSNENEILHRGTFDRALSLRRQKHTLQGDSRQVELPAISSEVGEQ